MDILIINGPNLNLLGKRQPSIYGDISFDEYIQEIKREKLNISVFQSNVEGEIINAMHDSKSDGIILNAGGYTHTSVAIRDAVSSIEIPVVEVHISNIAARESFRHESLISPVAAGCIFGFGIVGYEMAIDYFLKQKK